MLPPFEFLQTLSYFAPLVRHAKLKGAGIEISPPVWCRTLAN